MATAQALDKEVAPTERPMRPLVSPAGAPHSPIMPDLPLTPGEKQALEEERYRDMRECSSQAQGGVHSAS